MIFCELFKQELSLATKVPVQTAFCEKQDYSIHRFVVKNRTLQPFLYRLTAASLYPYKMDNLSYTGPAKVLDNSQQYIE